MKSPKILIIDDSPFIRKALLGKLKKFGAQVTQAENGHQGLERARSNKFDLIISDVDMPKLNGFELCEKLKNSPESRSIPVIILSSMDSDQHIDRGFKAGAAAYINKSDTPTQLLETIERVLKKAFFQQEQRILVVDDSSIIRKIVKKALGEAGFNIASAKNGKKALELIDTHRPDLILSDIDMPEMNGVDFFKAVHANQNLSSIPFIIMSGNKDRAMVRRMLDRGASAYMVKPFNLEQLVATVEKLLSDQFLLLLKDRERLETERKMMLASITSLIEALEARDPYTRGHSETVASIVTGMAAEMNMSQDEINTLGIGARLHDLGKIGVPDSVLLKEGPLTDEEFAIIKSHPVTGAEILGPIPTLENIIPVILLHHERFDGKGYPKGLKGNQIPLWARMAAVADTYDALVSDRPYRKGMSQQKALRIIDDVRGTQLCPECTNVFFKWISKPKRRTKYISS